MYEPESEVVHWGLNFFDVDHIFSSNYYGDSNHVDENISSEWYFATKNGDREDSNIENDEIIAHTLQEELSRLTMAEASESTRGEDEHFQTSSTSAPDWATQYSGYEGVQVNSNADELRPSSSCSSPESISYGGDDYSLELTDESLLDGEVGKRLNHLITIPHVPRINGDIPSIDEATSDHQRLLDRLQVYDLIERKVQGDGNCQFRALSDQFYRSPDHHKFVRQQVVNQLKSHRDAYEGYVPMDYDDYLKKLTRNGEWGDHVTLQAAADSLIIIELVIVKLNELVLDYVQVSWVNNFSTAFQEHQYGVKINVVTSFKDTCFIEILPKSEKSKRVVFLSFWAEVHYNSIYPQGGDSDIPPSEFRRKRRWWTFGSKH